MKITEIAVERPAALVMAIILIIGLGVIGYTSLGADLFPSVDVPIITITTTYSGAGVEEIENNIVKPIEDRLAGIRGIDSIESTAVIGYSYTIVRFTMETDMTNAFTDAQQALADVSKDLPKDASQPALQKVDMNALPVMMLSISGDVPYEVLYNYADKTKTRIEKIPGVGSIILGGELKKEVQINVDKLALEYYGIGINTIVARLKGDNINFPAGEIEQNASSKILRIIGEVHSLDDIKNIRIQSTNGSDIPLSEIAKIDFEYPDEKELLRFDGKKIIGINIKKQSDANIVETTKRITKELEIIKKNTPNGIDIAVASDASKFITATLKEVNKNMIEGILTTSLVMFLFMRGIRSSLIVLVSIPTSLVATFFMMYVAGLTLNIMTLMALSMSIGILVDDSIVVIENIQRHMKFEKNPIKAAIEGRKEIAMSAIAITLCDIVVFGPIAFVTGIVGKYFTEFGLTVVFATAFSLIVSFTVTPMLSARLLKKEVDAENSEDNQGVKQNKLSRFERAYNWLNNKYKNFLEWSLDHRWKIIGLIILLIALSISLIPLGLISSEFSPSPDTGVFSVEIALNPGTNIKQTDDKVKIVENYLKTIPEVKNYFSDIGKNNNTANATLTVNMVDKESRKRSQKEVISQVRRWCKTLSGIDVSINEMKFGGGDAQTKPIVVYLSGADQKILKELSKELKKKIGEIQGITDLGSSIEAGKSEFNLQIDRLSAGEYGQMTIDIANTLRTAINGTTAGIYRKDGDEFNIVVKLQKGQITTASELASLKIINTSGKQVSLGDVAKISEIDSTTQLKRKDRQSTVYISAAIEGRSLGEVNKDLNKILGEMKLPNEYQISFGADQKNMKDTFDSIIKVIIASVALVYMILVVLYESYLTPLIRMLSLPAGIIGALLALAITGNSLNIISLIGLIMLDGLASKNGTLLIDYTNKLMKQGMPLREALITSGTRRLRPILMTSITMIVAMLPAAITMGEGTELKKGMAVVLVGGIITSTIFSPILLPVAYSLLDDFKNKIFKKKTIKSEEV